MPRQVFYTFDYRRDAYRVAQVRSIGTVQHQRILRANAWEDVADGGDRAIKAWIDGQMRGKSCDVVLIGSRTAGRKWVEYEIKKAWGDGKGVVGLRIHGLRGGDKMQAAEGPNPFSRLVLDTTSRRIPFEDVAPVHDPPYAASRDVYACIAENLEEWVEEDIRVRGRW